MDSPNPLSLLLSGLQRLDVLPSHALAEALQRPEAQGDDPQPLGRWLFQQGYLTRYQLNQLATGRDDDLVIGPYMLLEKIAEGGGGQVFKARHKVMNRIVALKRIRPEMLERPELVQRFFQETQVAAQLDHPNVVRAFDAGQVGPSCYLVMEFVDGIDLTRLVLEGGPLAIWQACDFMRQAALGLQHAHERGLVHRDVKPSNMLVTPVNRLANAVPSASSGAVIKLLDLGLARWHTEPITGNGRGLGTPQFVAPEQARSGDAADIRSDLYSLGCTFFYLLTGRPPFEGARQEILQQHLHQEAPRVESIRPGVPVSIGDAIHRLLQKKPKDRFSTPKELVATLTTIGKSLTPDRPGKTPAPPPPRPEPTEPAGPVFADESGVSDIPDDVVSFTKARAPVRTRAGSSTKKTLALIFGIGLHVIAAVIVIGVLWWKYGRTPDKPDDKGETRPIAKVTPIPEKPKDNSPREPEKKADPLTPQPKSKTAERFAKGTPPTGKEPIDVARLHLTERKRRTYPEKPAVLNRLADTPTGSVKCLAFVPGKTPGLIYADQKLRVLDSTTGKPLADLPGGSADVIEANPNGVFVAGISNRQLQVWSIDPPGAPQTLADGTGATCLTHSPNGNYVLAGSDDGKVRLWDLLKREVERTLDVGEPVSAVAIANNGWLAIVGTERGQVLFFDLESQTKLGSAQRHQEAIRSISVSPDDQLIATVGEDQKILTWSVNNGQPRDFMPLDRPLQSVAFVGNDWGVVGSRGGRMYCFHLPTRNAVAYGDESMGTFQALTVSADGRYVYAAFSQMGVGRLDYDPPADQPKPPPTPAPPTPTPTKPVVTDLLKDARVLVEHQLAKAGHAQRIRFSPDGQSIAASGSDGSVLVFSATASSPPVVIPDAADPHQPTWWIANKLVSTTGFINPKEKTVSKHVTPQPVSAVGTTGTGVNDQVLLGLENGSLYRVKPNLPLYNSFWPVFDKLVAATAFSKDGKLALAATRERAFACPLDRADPKPVEIGPVSGRVRLLMFIPGAEPRGIVVDDKSAVLYSLPTGKTTVLRQYRLPESGSIRAAAMTASGSHLIMCIGEKVFLLSIDTGDVVGRMELAPYTVVHGVDISADGRRLSIATNKQLLVWELSQALTAGASP